MIGFNPWSGNKIPCVATKDPACHNQGWAQPNNFKKATKHGYMDEDGHVTTKGAWSDAATRSTRTASNREREGHGLDPQLEPPEAARWSRAHLPMKEVREMWGQSLGHEDLLVENLATHSSIFAWEIPWTEEPGGLQSRVTKIGQLNTQQPNTEWSL